MANSEPTSLRRYRQKRDFTVTPEPEPAGTSSGSLFVVQKHWASHLHYDLRLELDGVLLSWAVPKGPCYDPQERRMAIQVEDHPVSYAGFEGTIPPKQYGAGSVIVWDRGTWDPIGDPRAGLQDGKLLFKLHGEKLVGKWELVRISKTDATQWMLFKKRDEWARPLSLYDVITALPDSVVVHPLGLREAVLQPAIETTIELTQAVRALLPAKLTPQGAVLASTLPVGGDWIVETKFDGYRMMARIDQGRVRFFTSGGQDWTNKLKSLASAVEKLGITEAWLDGEAVVLKAGIPNFNALQNAIATRGESIVYFLFDLPYWGGVDLRLVPLKARRAQLKQLIGEPSERIRFSDSFDAPPKEVFQAACDLGLEGLMLKRSDAIYTSGPSSTWLKAKCKLRQEFVICGFTERGAASREVGALLLGYHEAGRLRYAGRVGTGWNAKGGQELRARLSAVETPARPFDANAVRHGSWAGGEHWVKPILVCEVAFAEWTPAGHVRHASFKGLRSDKTASQVTREAAKTAFLEGAAVKITHPERVIDESTGITKLELVRYYESVATWMLPHLVDRPVSLLRAPSGIAGELFFQKHSGTKMPGLTEHDPSLWPGHAALLSIDSPDALVAATQMNVVEFHPWNSTVGTLTAPDRIVFDLDPGEGIKWQHVQEAALLVQTLLTELGLKAWLKTSGGKGLHVVVPLKPKLDYDTVRAFSKSLALHLARTIPSRFSAKSGPANRPGKVFVDYLRNGFGQTTVAAFSARARPGMGVSMPVAWEQLMALKSGSQWTIRTAREYLSFQTVDPWSAYWETRQELTGPLERLN
ncbi:DNA ligase D [Pseudomonas sp. 2FE]|uniref:DNA ligase D n=1 Tax=Pseudomonas sp. 2FE TaxID=2502190 RepID=UPI0010F8FBAF|nr:DNA ligase D [Pseudomonas sp. 2FE]